MTVGNVSLRLQSRVLTCEELSKLAGVSPTRCGDIFNGVLTWAVDSDVPDELELQSHLKALKPAKFDADLVIAVGGAPLGQLMSLTAMDLRLLASARCGLVLDVYSEWG